MKKKILFLLPMILVHVCMFAQTKTKIVVPSFGDKYAEMVKQLEMGQTDINYRAFRESFIESEQFKIASGKVKVLDSLEKVMYAQMDVSNYPEVLKITQAILGIDYTSMLAHKILRQTYQLMGDTVNSNKYHDIQFGLLKSIVSNGDGKTCATGWPVIQISEEYFILQMLGADLQGQSLSNDGGICDKMDVTIDGKAKTYYFEVSKIFEGYNKLGLK
jgi:hypothetical protein